MVKLTKKALPWLGLAFASMLLLTGAAPERVVLRPLNGPDGRPIDLNAPAKGATVIVFYSSECPISNAYSPTLNRLIAEAPADRLRVVGICVDPDLTDADVAAHAKDFNLKFPVARDPRGFLAKQLGATVTPEAFVIDADHRIRYYGRIDDQFAGRRQPNANPETHEVKDAIDALLASREVKIPHVKAVGCPIPDPPKAPTASEKGK